MRLLSDWSNHAGCCFPGEESPSDPSTDHHGDVRQSLSLRHLRSHSSCRRPGRQVRRRTMTPISRREFFSTTAAAATGIVISFYLPESAFAATDASGFSPNAYLSIAPDGKITVVVARSEMGQGVWTALPMILAEELEADWKKIAVEQAGASMLYGDQSTGGSASVRTTWDPMRKAGAQAREMLITAAALEWGVPRATCKPESGYIVHASSNRRLSYGQLADKAASLAVPTD